MADLVGDRRGPGVQVAYLRLPHDLQTYELELLHAGPHCRIALQLIDRDSGPTRLGAHTSGGGGEGQAAAIVSAGGALLWFVFPAEGVEVAAAYEPGGELLGYYSNLVRLPVLEPGVWRITDLFLDVWQDSRGQAVLLDEQDLEQAVERDWVDSSEAEDVRAGAAMILRAAEEGEWPPAPVPDWPLAAVPSLRLLRDEPGIWHANLVAGRIIAFGIYFLGAVALTTLAFEALSGSLSGRAAVSVWKLTLATEAVILLTLALAGRLPGTKRTHRREALTERTLFIGTLAMGAAVFLNRDSRVWTGSLVGVYAALALFLIVFSVSRLIYDREIPYLAVAGLIVAAAALVVLL